MVQVDFVINDIINVGLVSLQHLECIKLILSLVRSGIIGQINHETNVEAA